MPGSLRVGTKGSGCLGRAFTILAIALRLMGSYRDTLTKCFPAMQFSISPELPTEIPSERAKDLYQRLAAAFRVLPLLEHDRLEEDRLQNHDGDALQRVKQGLEYEFVII